MRQVNYANRGQGLELLIEMSNTQYMVRDIALIIKFPTPIKPLKMKGGKIIQAYFQKKSFLDFIGIYKDLNKSISVAFDAKETRELDRFPLKNVEEHQVRYMERFRKYGGIAFLIVNFVKRGKYFRLPYWLLKDFWDDWQKNKGKRGYAYIPYETFEKYCFEIKSSQGIPLHYLENVEDDLEEDLNEKEQDYRV